MNRWLAKLGRPLLSSSLHRLPPRYSNPLPLHSLSSIRSLNSSVAPNLPICPSRLQPPSSPFFPVTFEFFLVILIPCWNTRSSVVVCGFYVVNKVCVDLGERLTCSSLGTSRPRRWRGRGHRKRLWCRKLRSTSWKLTRRFGFFVFSVSATFCWSSRFESVDSLLRWACDLRSAGHLSTGLGRWAMASSGGGGLGRGIMPI